MRLVLQDLPETDAKLCEALEGCVNILFQVTKSFKQG